MTSYLRSLFGIGPVPHPPPSSTKRARSSTSSEKTSSYVYIKTHDGSHGPTSKQTRSRSFSYSANVHPATAPVPQRHTPYEPVPHASRVGFPERPPMPSRSSSYNKQERDPQYPYSIYTAAHVSLSNRSSSTTSSVHHGRQRNPSSGSAVSSASIPTRPALKQRSSSYSSTKKANVHVTFMNPSRTDTLHMHPLLASTRQSRAPISYDVSYPPSHRTVVDRNTRAPVPPHTLDQPATDPVTLSTLVLTSDGLPWEVVVSNSHHHHHHHYSASSQARSAQPVTNNDVLHALYSTLDVGMTQEEWNALGHGGGGQKRIWKAYESRCKRQGGGWEKGVKRIDWLGGKTKLVGIEVDKTRGAGQGRILFSKP